MLPNGGLFDEEGNQLDPENLKVVAKGVLTNLPNGKAINEEGKGGVAVDVAVPALKKLGWWEKITDFMKSLKGSAKDAEATGQIITKNVPRKAGDIVEYEGETYIWNAGKWWLKNKKGNLEIIKPELNAQIEKAIERKAVGINSNDIPAVQRKQNGEPVPSKAGPNDGVVKPPAEKPAPKPGEKPVEIGRAHV